METSVLLSGIASNTCVNETRITWHSGTDTTTWRGDHAAVQWDVKPLMCRQDMEYMAIRYRRVNLTVRWSNGEVHSLWNVKFAARVTDEKQTQKRFKQLNNCRHAQRDLTRDQLCSPKTHRCREEDLVNSKFQTGCTVANPNSSFALLTRSSFSGRSLKILLVLHVLSVLQTINFLCPNSYTVLHLCPNSCSWHVYCSVLGTYCTCGT